MEDLDRRLLLGSAGLVGLAALASKGTAGPLNPPAGPVAPTGRTLDAVEPRKPLNATTAPGTAFSMHYITQPGSYYLTGDVVGEAGKNGIFIEASDVHIDLMGFRVLGVPGSQTGIAQANAAGARGVSIANGSVRGWGGSGISASVTGTRVERVRSSGNAFSGIETNNSSVISDCVCHGNGSRGLSAGNGATVSRCTCEGNGAGFVLFGMATLNECGAHNNTGHGFDGQRFTARNCAASVNGGNGFNMETGASALQCVAHQNSGHGIRVVNGLVRECQVQTNGLHGILVEGSSAVRGNHCVGNGVVLSGYGIAVTGTRCRIDENHCVGNDRGIDVTGSANLIIRNFVGGNNGGFGYAVVGGNLFGPNVVPANNQINVGTNPHANYEY
ncbi:MAG TPA: right-handed parallel beta-helix repeat-containing protein [Phycisphaerales bacterium]|nr:right-handed parallel beta-helix repeat-containing protein [Phycisphaerales bacterium]